MDKSIWIVNLIVLATVLGTDLGYREVGVKRLLRPVLAAAIVVPMFVKHPATDGSGLLLELAGAGVGLLLGLGAAALMKVGRDEASGKVYSRTGAPYAALWIAVIGGRLLFSYGANHWFGEQLGRWMYQNQITADALTDALILMAITMLLGRTGTLAARKGRATGIAFEMRQEGLVR